MKQHVDEAVHHSQILAVTGRVQRSCWEGRGCVLSWCRLCRGGKEHRRAGILEEELGKDNLQWPRAALRGDGPGVNIRGTWHARPLSMP